MIRTSPDVEKISEAWVAAQAELPNVPKETKGQVGNAVRNYADIASVTDTARPILAKHGIGYIQGLSNGEHGGVKVTTRLIHSSGQWFEDDIEMPTGQNTPQAFGSATTYARRYALTAMLGLAPEDDDGAAATFTSAPAQRRQAAPRTPGKASEAQLTKLQITLAEAGIKSRQDRLDYCVRIIGHPIESSKDLTPQEAGAVIDHLERLIEEQVNDLKAAGQ